MRFALASSNAHKIAEIAALLGQPVRAAGEFCADFSPIEDGADFAQNALIKARALAGYAGGFCVIADDSGLCVSALGGAPGVFSARFAAVCGDFAACGGGFAAGDLDAGAAGAAGAAGVAKIAGATNCTDEQNRAALAKALRAKGQAASWGEFACAIAICAPFGERVFSASAPGLVVCFERGSGGFGYDAMFFPAEANADLAGIYQEFSRSHQPNDEEALKIYLQNCKSFAELAAAEKNAISHRGKALFKLKQFLNSADF